MVQVGMPQRPQYNPRGGSMLGSIAMDAPQIVGGAMAGQEFEDKMSLKQDGENLQKVTDGYGKLESFSKGLQTEYKELMETGIDSADAFEYLLPKYQEQWVNEVRPAFGDVLSLPESFAQSIEDIPKIETLRSKIEQRVYRAQDHLMNRTNPGLGAKMRMERKKELAKKERVDKAWGEYGATGDREALGVGLQEPGLLPKPTKEPTAKEIAQTELAETKTKLVKKKIAAPAKPLKRAGAMTEQQRYKNLERKALGIQEQLDVLKEEDVEFTDPKKVRLENRLGDIKMKMKKLMEGKPTQVTPSPKQKYSQADIEATAQRKGLTVEEVRKRLGIK